MSNRETHSYITGRRAKGEASATDEQVARGGHTRMYLSLKTKCILGLLYFCTTSGWGKSTSGWRSGGLVGQVKTEENSMRLL